MAGILVGSIFVGAVHDYLTFILGITNSWKAIWPMFGASNQLVASLALFVISSYLIGMGRPRIYTVLPAIFMLLTTLGALAWLINHHLFAETPNLPLGITACILVGLAIFLMVEGVRVLVAKGKPATTE